MAAAPDCGSAIGVTTTGGRVADDGAAVTEMDGGVGVESGALPSKVGGGVASVGLGVGGCGVGAGGSDTGVGVGGGTNRVGAGVCITTGVGVGGTGKGVLAGVGTGVGAGVGGTGVGDGGMGIGVATWAVRFTSMNAPCRQVAVCVARTPPTMKVMVAPSVPQPGRVAAEATSMTNMPAASVTVKPPAGATVQSTEPIIATIAVPAGAVTPPNCACPYTRVGGVTGVWTGVPGVGDWAAVSGAPGSRNAISAVAPTMRPAHPRRMIIILSSAGPSPQSCTAPTKHSRKGRRPTNVSST